MTLQLYAADTPNNRKITIALAEMGIAWRAIPIDLGAGDQFAPAFLAISPSGKTPAILDLTGSGESVALFESGAILTYLADKSGTFLPTEPQRRWTALAWTCWQTAGLGPTLGQAWHFARRCNQEPGGDPYAARRFANEGRRLWGVMEARLAVSTHLGDETMTIADMAVYPWVSPSRRLLGLRWEGYPNLRRWWETMSTRPGVRAGMRALRGL